MVTWWSWRGSPHSSGTMVYEVFQGTWIGPFLSVFLNALAAWRSPLWIKD